MSQTRNVCSQQVQMRVAFHAGHLVLWMSEKARHLSRFGVADMFKCGNSCGRLIVDAVASPVVSIDWCPCRV